MQEDKKSQLDTLSKFLEFYDYSYWHFKLEMLYKVIENEEFINGISKQFTEGGDV